MTTKKLTQIVERLYIATANMHISLYSIVVYLEESFLVTLDREDLIALLRIGRYHAELSSVMAKCRFKMDIVYSMLIDEVEDDYVGFEIPLDEVDCFCSVLEDASLANI